MEPGVNKSQNQVGEKALEEKESSTEKRTRRKGGWGAQMTISGKSVSPLCPSPWCHSPTARLPIKALIKTDKVSPNEERAVGGLNC